MINWIYGSGFKYKKLIAFVMARKGVNKELNLDDCRVGDDLIDTGIEETNKKKLYSKVVGQKKMVEMVKQILYTMD